MFLLRLPWYAESAYSNGHTVRSSLSSCPKLPKSSIVVEFCGLYLGSYKVIPKRNYYGACGYREDILSSFQLLAIGCIASTVIVFSGSPDLLLFQVPGPLIVRKQSDLKTGR